MSEQLSLEMKQNNRNRECKHIRRIYRYRWFLPFPLTVLHSLVVGSFFAISPFFLLASLMFCYFHYVSFSRNSHHNQCINLNALKIASSNNIRSSSSNTTAIITGADTTNIFAILMQFTITTTTLLIASSRRPPCHKQHPRIHHHYHYNHDLH